MKSVNLAIILASSACVFGLAGCAFKVTSNVNQPQSVESNSQSNSAKTNVEELGMLINVPYETEDIVWKEIVPQKKLVAVIRVSRADADKIVEDVRNIKPPETVTLQSENWFPVELIAQSDVTGDDTLKGVAYSAQPFFQEPFSDGMIVRIDGTEYFVIEMSAK
jgi:hypothetical protein